MPALCQLQQPLLAMPSTKAATSPQTTTMANSNVYYHPRSRLKGARRLSDWGTMAAVDSNSWFRALWLTLVAPGRAAPREASLRGGAYRAAGSSAGALDICWPFKREATG